MRMTLLALWAIVLFGGWAYHEGPGQDGMILDECLTSCQILRKRSSHDRLPDYFPSQHRSA